MRSIFMCCFIIILGFSLVGCSIKNIEENAYIQINRCRLQDLGSKEGQEVRNRVYIEEDGTKVPYILLTDNYCGNCLLLREYLLDEPMRFNNNGWYAAYYEDSEVDLFLNKEFCSRISEVVRDSIIDSTIEITAKDSLGVGGKDTISIIRKVFLLSYTEVNMSGSRTNLIEGVPLKYFSDKESRVAYYYDGREGSWWLRTPNTADVDVVCGVSIDGAVGVGGIGGDGGEYLNGVRPAFCLPKDTIVIENYDGWGKIYTIGKESN